MTALEKYIARRRADGVGPDAMIGSAPAFASTTGRTRKGGARPMFRDYFPGQQARKAEVNSIAI